MKKQIHEDVRFCFSVRHFTIGLTWASWLRLHASRPRELGDSFGWHVRHHNLALLPVGRVKHTREMKQTAARTLVQARVHASRPRKKNEKKKKTKKKKQKKKKKKKK